MHSQNKRSGNQPKLVLCTCSRCPRTLYPEEEDDEDGCKTSFACRDHENITPKFQYCLNASITDDTNTTDVVIYDETMTDALRTECRVMVLDKGNIDQKVLPPEISAVIGVPKLFELTKRADNSISVNGISDTPDTNVLQPKSASTSTSLTPQTPDPKRKRPMQDVPGEKRQKM
ncbi:uncharacterized protein LOC143553320 [Bidens hawaiensis]|uniref:uncharacterized protein LOC143553320 n=1 Tax=Bidens hawaiensis TaxID=980011 RepID=UPI00404AA608